MLIIRYLFCCLLFSSLMTDAIAKDAYHFTGEEIHGSKRVNVKIRGRVVLPKEKLGKAFELEKFKIYFHMPYRSLSYPKGYAGWDKLKKKRWSESSEGKRWRALKDAKWDFSNKWIYVKVDTYGRFEVDLNWLGKYEWGYTSNVAEGEGSDLAVYVAQKHGDFMVGEIANDLDLGDIELRVYRRQIVGDLLENFEVPGLEDGVVRSSDYRDKFLLIDFWATWCGPCLKQMPFIQDALKKYKKDGLVLLMLSMDKERQNGLEYVTKKGLAAKGQGFVGFDGSALKKGSSFKKHLPRSLPHIMLVGPDGRILAIGLRGDGIVKSVVKHIAAYKDSRKK